MTSSPTVLTPRVEFVPGSDTTVTQQLVATPARLQPASKPLKVTLVIDRMLHDLAGTEGQVMALMRGLSPRLQIELIVLEDSPWVQEQQRLGRFNIKVIALAGGIRRRAFWSGARRLVQHLRQTRPDVVHSFFPIANIVGVVAARLAGVPSIVSSRRDCGIWMTRGYLAATRGANRLLQRVLVNSPEVKRFTQQAEGLAAERISVIPNAVDLSRWQPRAPDLALKAAIGIPAQHRVIGLVANFRQVKRQDSLIEALARLAPTHSDVSLLFVGDPRDPHCQTLRALVAQHQLGDRVFFAHAAGDVERYLSFMDLACNCSETEGLSNAVMEYMAAGLPCVVSDGGGNKDLVRHEVSGLVYPVGDAQALAVQLARLLNEPALGQRLAAAARDRIQREMALPVVLDQFERFYRDVRHVG